ACYIDEQAALVWWHRNVAKSGHYHVQGWRKAKVYPDFLFGLKETGGQHKVMVVETKGDQLAGNDDTKYKRKLLELMTQHFREDGTTKAGELELVVAGDTKVVCDMVLISDWKTKVPHYFS
ncbi:MAG: type III restriction endonuclease subunit R, partial [Pseudomonas sp.]|nr:type III restriction endonuclease subunit R [Pseudomonas sp.]